MRFAVGFVLLLAAGIAPAANERIQCWTDDKGQRMCGDRVPPEYADRERKILNEHGQVVDTKRGAPTAEEIADAERRKREAEAAAKRAEYDRSLLDTYRSASDIQAMRDERLAFIDGRINAAKKSLEDNEQSLTDLRARAATQQKDKGKVDDRLAKQVKQFERSLERNQKSLAAMQKEREDTKSKFDYDLARFSELRGLPPAAPAPPNQATPPVPAGH